MRSKVYVLRPDGTKEDAAAIRRVLQSLGVSVSVGSAAGHTPGQSLYGDVIVIGSKPATIDADAVGEVHHVHEVSGLEALVKELSEGESESKPRPTAGRGPDAPPSAMADRTVAELREVAEERGVDLPAGYVKKDDILEALDESDETKPDQFDGMTRVELIQHAARHWPGQRQWANLGNDELRATIRELSAE